MLPSYLAGTYHHGCHYECRGVSCLQGTAVGFPWFAYGHNAAVYGPDVEQFTPDRWMDEGASTAWGADGDSTDTAADSTVYESKGKVPDPWTFAVGPRDCAGQALARIELQVRGWMAEGEGLSGCGSYGHSV